MITQYLTGHPACLDTMKTMVAAAEKGVDLEVTVIDCMSGANKQADYLAKVPTDSVPYLRDADLIMYTIAGIISYVDDKGFGPSLTPRNAIARSRMLQWISVGHYHLHPYVHALIMSQVLGQSACPNMEEKRQAAAVALDAMEKYMNMDRVEGESRFTPRDAAKGTIFICGFPSQADMHWAPYIHGLNVAGQADMVNAHPKIKAWFETLKTRQSKASSVKTLDWLPSADDMKAGKFAKPYYQAI
jgi:glutathione S-transferase